MIRSLLIALMAMLPAACNGDSEDGAAADVAPTGDSADPVQAWEEAATGPAGRLSPDAAAYAALAERLGPDWLDQFTEVVNTEDLALRHRSALQSHQDEIAELMRLAQSQQVDFGFRIEDGGDALLPHLAVQRKFAKVLRADALRLAEAGDASSAADRLVAVVGIARQLEGDQLIISTLVALANLAMVFETTNELIEADRLTPDAASRIADELRTINEGDPGGARAALLNEVDVMVYSLRHNLFHPEGEYASIRQMTDAQRQAVADELERLRLAIEEAWDQRDAPALLERIHQRAEEPAARMLLAAYDMFHRQVTRSGRDLRTTLQRLERVAGQ